MRLSVYTFVRNDLTVNPLKTKKLTNVRAAGSDDNIILTPAVHMSLEQSLEFINEDELVEVSPVSLRIRKKKTCLNWTVCTLSVQQVVKKLKNKAL